jgi:hypothetical protein
LAYAERERANALVHAEKRMHISYQALRIAVEYFSELNENLLASIDRERSTAREANLVLGNAITVFELTEFVIRYVERFRLDGHDDIHRLHREAKVASTPSGPSSRRWPGEPVRRPSRPTSASRSWM